MSAAADRSVSLNAVSSASPPFSSSPLLTPASYTDRGDGTAGPTDIGNRMFRKTSPSMASGGGGTSWIGGREMSASDDWSALADSRLIRLMSAPAALEAAAVGEPAALPAHSVSAAVDKREIFTTESTPGKNTNGMEMLVKCVYGEEGCLSRGLFVHLRVEEQAFSLIRQCTMHLQPRRLL